MDFVAYKVSYSLLLLLGLPLLLIGGIIVLIVLLANEKTRAAGLVLLAVMLFGFGGLVAAGAAAFYFLGQNSAEVIQPLPPQETVIELPPGEITVVEVVGPTPETAGERVEEIEQ